MQKFWSWFLGTFIGGLVGALTVFFFAPVDGEDFRANLRDQYQNAMKAGREASAQKRAELEAELKSMHEDG